MQELSERRSTAVLSSCIRNCSRPPVWIVNCTCLSQPPPDGQNLSKPCSLLYLRLPTFGFKSLGAGRQRFSLAFAWAPERFYSQSKKFLIRLASPIVTQRREAEVCKSPCKRCWQLSRGREAVVWRPQSPLAAMPTLTSPSCLLQFGAFRGADARSHLGSQSMAWSFNLSVALIPSAFGDMYQLLA